MGFCHSSAVRASFAFSIEFCYKISLRCMKKFDFWITLTVFVVSETIFLRKKVIFTKFISFGSVLYELSSVFSIEIFDKISNDLRSLDFTYGLRSHSVDLLANPSFHKGGETFDRILSFG